LDDVKGEVLAVRREVGICQEIEEMGEDGLSEAEGRGRSPAALQAKVDGVEAGEGDLGVRIAEIRERGIDGVHQDRFERGKPVGNGEFGEISEFRGWRSVRGFQLRASVLLSEHSGEKVSLKKWKSPRNLRNQVLCLLAPVCAGRLQLRTLN
jgi:hypothetical protein